MRINVQHGTSTKHDDLLLPSVFTQCLRGMWMKNMIWFTSIVSLKRWAGRGISKGFKVTVNRWLARPCAGIHASLRNPPWLNLCAFAQFFLYLLISWMLDVRNCVLLKTCWAKWKCVCSKWISIANYFQSPTIVPRSHGSGGWIQFRTTYFQIIVLVSRQDILY